MMVLLVMIPFYPKINGIFTIVESD